MISGSPYIAKRVQAGIPIWDIFAHGQDIGILTNLPMEDSPMATVRYFGSEKTFAGETIRDVLAQVGDHLREIDSEMDAQADQWEAEHAAEYFAEVIGPMQAAERAAERWAEQAYRDEPPEAF